MSSKYRSNATWLLLNMSVTNTHGSEKENGGWYLINVFSCKEMFHFKLPSEAEWAPRSGASSSGGRIDVYLRRLMSVSLHGICVLQNIQIEHGSSEKRRHQSQTPACSTGATYFWFVLTQILCLHTGLNQLSQISAPLTKKTSPFYFSFIKSIQWCLNNM